MTIRTKTPEYRRGYEDGFRSRGYDEDRYPAVGGKDGWMRLLPTAEARDYDRGYRDGSRDCDYTRTADMGWDGRE